MGAFCVESGRVVTLDTDSDMYFTHASTSSVSCTKCRDRLERVCPPAHISSVVKNVCPGGHIAIVETNQSARCFS